MILGLENTYTVGEDTFFDSLSPTSSYGVTFEDDLTTGYFYAVDTSPDLRILDALHIYNVDNVVDKNKPCNIKIVWTDNGLITMLLINNYCHAVFDFALKAGYCRTGFPDSNGEWIQVKERLLTDELIEEILKFSLHTQQ